MNKADVINFTEMIIDRGDATYDEEYMDYLKSVLRIAKAENPKKLKGVNIKCPKDLNKYLISEPVFENTFPADECEMKKYYGDCFHCFASSIAKRDHEKANMIPFSTAGTRIKRVGKWENVEGVCTLYKCSRCDVGSMMQFNFCPNCGADMGVTADID